MVDSTRALFEHELKDTYDVEFRLVDALKKMSSKVTDGELKRGFDQHRDQTERQIERLNKSFAALGISTQREECEGIKGLIEEFEEFLGENPPGEILDVFACTAALKTEHYEIIGYQSLIKLAYQAGLDDAVPPLKENLAEEEATAKKLEGLSEKLVAQLPK